MYTSADSCMACTGQQSRPVGPPGWGMPMISIKIDTDDTRSLVDQIVTGIRRLIDERTMRPGSKLPSIRNLAESYGISRFTAVEAYDRLVAQGYLEARRGAGFFSKSVREEPTR